MRLVAPLDMLEGECMWNLSINNIMRPTQIISITSLLDYMIILISQPMGIRVGKVSAHVHLIQEKP